MIVLDDGSSDATPAIVTGFGNAVRFVQLGHGGVSKARNAGIDMARGAYVAFLDSDDYWFPQRLQRAASFLQNGRSDCFLNTDYYVEQDGKRSRTPYYRSRSLECLFALDARGAVRICDRRQLHQLHGDRPRRMLQAAGGFNPNLRYGEDWDLWLRMLDRGHPVR